MPHRAVLLLALLLPAAAQAAVVKGTVSFADGVRARRFPGYWQLENGIVPVGPAPSKGETVVLLEGPAGSAPAAKTVTVEIVGLDAQPRAVVVGPGSVVEFKNADRATYELTIPDQATLMPPERLTPGAMRRQRFSSPGTYVVRCNEYPHLVISVLVVQTPHAAAVDEKGAFSIPAVPEGRATVRVWSQGRWVHEHKIEIGSKPSDLAIKVTPPERKEAAE